MSAPATQRCPTCGHELQEESAEETLKNYRAHQEWERRLAVVDDHLKVTYGGRGEWYNSKSAARALRPTQRCPTHDTILPCTICQEERNRIPF